jgi:protein involved in polysaccharide export with SLBB domain
MTRPASARPSTRRDLRACLSAGLAALLLCAGVSPARAQTDTPSQWSRTFGSIGEATPPPLPALPAAAASAPAAPDKPVAFPNFNQLPLPPDPALAAKPIVFGSQLFAGRFGMVPFSGFNPDYVIATGDRLLVRMWGAFNFEAPQVVDAHGNIFIPNVGPVAVRGVRNADLNKEVSAQIKRVFRSNVGVYATLESAQPVKIYVTGFVRAPGLYPGLSSDSILYYLDRAGGIDPARGSYLEVEVLRGGKPIAAVNLYRFLLQGKIDAMQLQEGDTIVAQPRRHTVQVGGEVHNPYIFEFKQATVSGAELLAVARPKPSATFMSIVRKIGPDTRAEYHPLSAAQTVTIEDGDEVTLTADKYPGTILVRIEGAQLGQQALVLPFGAKLADALARIKPAPQANIEAVQLYRQSIAARQKELIEISLRSLESYALTARSATSEEAALRQRESAAMMTFIERAKAVQPRGQLVLLPSAQAGQTILEDGDLIRVPNRSNTVLVSGEVVFPSALVWEPNASAKTFIARAGGYTQLADQNRLVVMHQDGSVSETPDAAVQPGDEVMVLPKITSKDFEIVRAITTILFQIAVAAKVLLSGF